MLAVVRKALNHISREGVRELGIHGVHERAADLLVPDFPRELDLRQEEGSDKKKKKKKKKKEGCSDYSMLLAMASDDFPVQRGVSECASVDTQATRLSLL